MIKMPTQKIVALVGSVSDLPFAHRIENFIKREHFSVTFEYKVNSAHRNPEKLLSDLKSYEKSTDDIVFITVAGLSDALSGVVSGYTTKPVIACPPDLKTYEWGKAFSSVATPKGVAVALVAEPENAALAAVKIFAVSNSKLKKAVEVYRDKMRKAVEKADAEIGRREVRELERTEENI
jgi:5-(carboxyamino)imidazole ribonucleotide mutase